MRSVAVCTRQVCLVESKYPIAACGEVQIVCYQYQGRAGGCGELEQQVRHLLAGVVVQIARGFVCQ